MGKLMSIHSKNKQANDKKSNRQINKADTSFSSFLIKKELVGA